MGEGWFFWFFLNAWIDSDVKFPQTVVCDCLLLQSIYLFDFNLLVLSFLLSYFRKGRIRDMDYGSRIAHTEYVLNHRNKAIHYDWLKTTI